MSARNVFSNRGFRGVRLALAQELARHTGSGKAFRSLVDQDSTPRQRLYSALDIRRARLRMSGVASDVDFAGPRLINVRMSKGGTGKTTVAANVASCMALMGLRCLLIDADPQASLTTVYGINWAEADITHVGELMRRAYVGQDPCMRDAVWKIYEGGMLDIIPADISLAGADAWLISASYRERTFAKLLEVERQFLSGYDVIIIDSAPGASLLTTAITYGCRSILAVVALNGHSVRAMEVLASNVQELNRHIDPPGIDVHIVANGYMAGYQSCLDSLEILRGQFGDYLDDNILPHAAAFMRDMSVMAEGDSGAVIEREPRSFGARAVIDLTNSLLDYYKVSLLPPNAAGRLPARARKTKERNVP